MKRIYLILLLGLVAVATQAQIPTPPDPSCAYCGVNLKTGEAHKSSCPYCEAPKEEDSSSSSSSHLKDYTPMPGMSSIEHTLIYEVGVNGKKPCSHCRSMIHHPWCEIINTQKWAKEYWAKAENASTEAARKQALRDYKRMVDNLKLFINLNYSVEDSKPLPEVKSRPIYESVKVVVAQQGSERREFYDVTQRDELGVLRHGLIKGAIVSGDNQTIPCVCDRIELIDRSPSNYGVLAKITVDGRMGIMDADNGDVII